MIEFLISSYLIPCKEMCKIYPPIRVYMANIDPNDTWSSKENTCLWRNSVLFKEELSSNFFSAFAKFVDHYRLCYNEKLFFFFMQSTEEEREYLSGRWRLIPCSSLLLPGDSCLNWQYSAACELRNNVFFFLFNCHYPVLPLSESLLLLRKIIT